MGSHIALRSVLVLAAIGPLELSSQRKIEISAVGTPPTYDVKLTRRAVLTDSGSPAKGLGWMIAVDSRKRYYASTGESHFLVFDSTGRLLRSVGRKGRGPGEYFGDAQVVIGPADTLLVFDWSSLTTLTPNYEYVRRVSARLVEPIWLSGGWLAQITSGYTREEINWLHLLELLDATGNGANQIEIGPPKSRDGPGRSRVVADGRDGTIWTTFFEKYVLEQWTRTGARQLILTRDLDGESFKGFSEIPFNTARVSNLLVDRLGRVWVSVLVRNGKKHRSTMRTEEGVREVEVDEYDTVIDVIDVKVRKLLASTRFTGWGMAMLAPGLVKASRELDDGSLGIEILDVSLVRRR
jgi:hypothetical protein